MLLSHQIIIDSNGILDKQNLFICHVNIGLVLEYGIPECFGDIYGIPYTKHE